LYIVNILQAINPADTIYHDIFHRDVGAAVLVAHVSNGVPTIQGITNRAKYKLTINKEVTYYLPHTTTD